MAAQLTPEQLARAVYLQRRLWTQERIANDLKVSQATVSRALSRHNGKVIRRLEKRTSAIKAQQIAQLEYLAEEAAAEWHRSKQDVETIKTTEEPTGNTPDGSISSPTKTETTVKGQTGDPSLLREIRGALADIRKILGLDIDRLETTSVGHGAPGFTDEQAKQADAKLAEWQAKSATRLSSISPVPPTADTSQTTSS